MALIELTIRTLCDTLPKCTADAVFLFGQTVDNQESVFASARSLLEWQRVRKIMFMHTDALSGYPGFQSWRRALVRSGIKDDFIEGVSSTGATSLNTLIEARAMARHAKRCGYTTVIVCASPFQQTRAFMTSVTAAMRDYPGLRIYSHPGLTLPWLEKVTHSQGRTEGTRAGLIAGELERIERYQGKGDLASDREVLDYLSRRS
jgi:hypothetical protein